MDSKSEEVENEMDGGERSEELAQAPVESIEGLFSNIGLEKYIDVFEDENIDLEVLRTLEDDDLREVGVERVGDRKRIIREIDRKLGAERKQNSAKDEAGGVKRG